MALDAGGVSPTRREQYTNHIIAWQGIIIALRYCDCYCHVDFDDDTYFQNAHLKVQTINPRRTRLPITETGYHSHFCDPRNIASAGGIVLKARLRAPRVVTRRHDSNMPLPGSTVQRIQKNAAAIWKRPANMTFLTE